MLNEEEKEDFFYWLTRECLTAYPQIPQKGVYSSLYNTIEYESAEGYLELVRTTEERNPEYNFNDWILELTDFNQLVNKINEGDYDGKSR